MSDTRKPEDTPADGVAGAEAPAEPSDPGTTYHEPRWRRWTWPVYARALARRSDPILVGPWGGELGFEVLYWLPFLQAAAKRYGIDPTRFRPVTRGGAGVLYGATAGAEIYGMRSLQQVRIATRLRHQQTGMVKQVSITADDRQILADAAAAMGLTRYQVLHPAWMYQALRPFFAGDRGLAWLFQRAVYPLLPPPNIDGITLPEHFIAARYYFRSTFPPTTQTLGLARESIKKLAKQVPVIVLSSGLHVDDHADFIPKDRTNVGVLSEMVKMAPEQNLAVIAAVLGRSDGFVGTYGGLAQLALRFGKPVVSVYDEWHSTALAHRHLSDALSIQHVIPWQVVPIRELPRLQAWLPSAVIKGSSGATLPARQIPDKPSTVEKLAPELAEVV